MAHARKVSVEASGCAWRVGALCHQIGTTDSVIKCPSTSEVIKLGVQGDPEGGTLPEQECVTCKF